MRDKTEHPGVPAYRRRRRRDEPHRFDRGQHLRAATRWSSWPTTSTAAPGITFHRRITGDVPHHTTNGVPVPEFPRSSSPRSSSSPSWSTTRSTTRPRSPRRSRTGSSSSRSILATRTPTTSRACSPHHLPPVLVSLGGVPGSRTDGLRRGIERALPDRPFTIELWDGSRVPSTRHGPTLLIHSPRAIGHLIRAPGELGLGRAYVCGDLSTDDLDGIIALLGRWQPPRLGLGRRLRVAASALRAAGLHRLPPPPAAELRPSPAPAHQAPRRRGRSPPLRRLQRLLRPVPRRDHDLQLRALRGGHADAGGRPAREAGAHLPQARAGARDAPARHRLRVGQPRDSRRAGARRRRSGASRCPSRRRSWPRARAREAGVGDRVEIRVMDYRDLREERFDAVASIGMVEHVGPRADRRVRGADRPGAGAGRPGAEPRHHPGSVRARRRAHRRRLLESLRVPGRRAAQRVANGPGLRARRASSR